MAVHEPDYHHLNGSDSNHPIAGQAIWNRLSIFIQDARCNQFAKCNGHGPWSTVPTRAYHLPGGTWKWAHEWQSITCMSGDLSPVVMDRGICFNVK